MEKYADKGGRALKFQVRDFMMLKLTPQIWKTINSKSVHHRLVPKYDGPFEVIKKVGNISYRLKLLDKLKVHSFFHVSFLKLFHKDATKPLRKQARCAPPTVKTQFQLSMGN